MIPILSSSGIRSVEQAGIRAGLTEAELMDRAARTCATHLLGLEREGRFGTAPRYHVMVGPGNNGGDGMLIALYLREAGSTVRVTLLEDAETMSIGNRAARDRLAHSDVPIDHISTSVDDIQIPHDEIVIDSILGTGASRPVGGLLARAVDAINRSEACVIAIDVPSGTIDPCIGPGSGAVVRAAMTFTIEVPKPALFFPETGSNAGRWDLLRIGLDPWYEVAEPRFANWVEPLDISKLLNSRERFSHKGDHGHALLIAGGPGCHGAALLSARGCSRSGVGLFTVNGTAETLKPIAVAMPDAMTSLDPSGETISEVTDLERYTSVLFGPGVGRSDRSAVVLRRLLGSWSGPLVIDADGLNLLSVDAELINALNTNVILTPHPREMDRLLGKAPTSGFDRLQRAKEFAHRHGCHIVLKGAYTAVCSPDGAVYYLPTGNAGMAKGGTGDVLAGVVAGLSAQRYNVLEASLISVYLHGRAGDLAADRLGMDAMRASDLVDALSTAWQELRSML